ILPALEYARSIGLDCRGVHVNINSDPQRLEKMRKDWDTFAPDIHLVILESDYRSLIRPVLEYVDEALREHPGHVITVIVPEYVPRHWWQSILHENAAFQIKLALSSRKNVIVTNVRYFLET
ncbi:MAG: amino acid permease, partial [bacterium]